MPSYDYPEGTRIELKSMNDPYARLSNGDMGTYEFTDDMGQIHVRWDRGSSLALIPGEDEFNVHLPKQELNQPQEEKVRVIKERWDEAGVNVIGLDHFDIPLSKLFDKNLDREQYRVDTKKEKQDQKTDAPGPKMRMR